MNPVPIQQDSTGGGGEMVMFVQFGVLGVLALGCLLVFYKQWKDKRDLALFKKRGGPAAADRCVANVPIVPPAR